MLMWLAAPAPGRAQDPEAPAEREAQSQVVPETPLPEMDAPTGVEAIEIVGERLDAANVQDEAQAITAFDMTDLDRANITNVDGLAFNVPSLHIGQQGNQAIVTLRGIGTENASITGEPGVQFHVDGINYARPAAARVAFFDLEAVRVHRGPHGTRGGKNSTAGAIHVVTRKPLHDELGIDGDMEWGSHDRWRWRAAFNVPLADERLSARLSMMQERHTGYQYNLAQPGKGNRADDADFKALRGQLRFTPLDTLDMLFSYNYYEAGGVGPGSKIVAEERVTQCRPDRAVVSAEIDRQRALGRVLSGARDLPDNSRQLFFLGIPPVIIPAGARFDESGQIVVQPPFTTRLPEAMACIGSQFIVQTRASEDPADPRQVYLDQIQQQDNKIWGWASTIDWDVPELPLLGLTRLSSITGYQRTILADPRDFDTTDVPFFALDPVDNDSYQYSSELRLESAQGDAVDWVTGLFYHRERSEAHIDGTVFGNAFGLAIDQLNITKSYGLYGESSFHFSDSLTLTAGARFSRDFKETALLRVNSAQTNQGGAVPTRTCLGRFAQNQYASDLNVRGLQLEDNVPDCKDDWRRWTGGVALEWRPSDDHLLYAQFDTGYKAGGFIIAESGDFEPETVKATTVGSKSLLLDGRLTVNLEGFYYRYRNLQVVEIDGLSIRTENAPRALVYGAELEFQAEPLPGLRLNGQLGYLNADFDEFRSVDPLDQNAAQFIRNDQICGTPDNRGIPYVSPNCLRPEDIPDLAGNQLARSPRWSWMLGAEYSIPLGERGTLTPRIQYYWQDETYYRAFNTPLDLQDEFHKTDLKLIWNSPQDVWAVELFLENLEDEDVFHNLLVGSQAIGSPALAQYAAPRIYGVRVGFRY